MKRYYRKQCILRHHEINDRTYETIDFLFRPSDIQYIIISHSPRMNYSFNVHSCVTVVVINCSIEDDDRVTSNVLLLS